MNRPPEFWNAVYDNGSAPWVIGEPQPAVLELIEQGWIRGAVLDVGCGAGEHTIRLTELGHDVLGVDLASSAIAYARANAREHGVSARFEVADALNLGRSRATTPFSTVRCSTSSPTTTAIRPIICAACTGS